MRTIVVFHDAEVIVCLKRVRREDGLEGGLEALVVLVRADAAGVEFAQRRKTMSVSARFARSSRRYEF